MSLRPIIENTLFYGDTLFILREYIASESVDLVYLNPPLNVTRNYSVLFTAESGIEEHARRTAFEDIWHWNYFTEQIYHELVTQAPENVSKLITALRQFIGTNQMMAYLVMVSVGLIELHRVLKTTGSLYLHCDPTVSHYVKIILDTVFGSHNFRMTIFWKHSNRQNDPIRHNSPIDAILFYMKGSTWTWNRRPLSNEESATSLVHFSQHDMAGLSWTEDDLTTRELTNGGVGSKAGHDAPKMSVLLEHIIKQSSNQSDVILDPFCSFGATITSAQKLGRRWIGIDITYLNIAFQKNRLGAMFPDINIYAMGEPIDEDAALQLALSDRYQFQWWTLSLIGALPQSSLEGSTLGKKGRDRGIDGIISFKDDNSGEEKYIIVQVKSGHVGSRDIRDLVGTLHREQAATGVFITMKPPTKEMKIEASRAGVYNSPGWNKDFPRIQILTVEQLLHNAEVQMPPQFDTLKQAQRV